jgi:hypothetical protein
MKTPVWQHNDADICDGSKPAARSFLSVERSEVRHNADPKAVQQARPPANPEPVPGHVAASPPEVRVRSHSRFASWARLHAVLCIGKPEIRRLRRCEDAPAVIFTNAWATEAP